MGHMGGVNVLLGVALVGLAGATGAARGATLDCSGTKEVKERRQFEVIKPHDRQMRQYVRLDTLNSRNPDIDGTEQTVYVHEEIVGTNGRHDGYGVFALRDGEQLWYRFEGTSYRRGEGSSWEARYHGIYRFISGTGRYAGIQGGAHYEGVVTPAGQTEEFTCSATY